MGSWSLKKRIKIHAIWFSLAGIFYHLPGYWPLIFWFVIGLAIVWEIIVDPWRHCDHSLLWNRKCRFRSYRWDDPSGSCQVDMQTKGIIDLITKTYAPVLMIIIISFFRWLV